MMTTDKLIRPLRGRRYLEQHGCCALIPMRVDFIWAPGDPFALHLGFPEAITSPPGMYKTVWSFGRDLLVDGLLDPVGDGDVTIKPLSERDYVEWVEITLTGKTGHAVIQFNAAEVLDYLNDTFAVIPLGAEEAAFDFAIDAWLADLDDEAA